VADLTQDADEGVNAQVESLLRAHAGDVEGILEIQASRLRFVGPQLL
jgi:hypothetical protein